MCPTVSRQPHSGDLLRQRRGGMEAAEDKKRRSGSLLSGPGEKQVYLIEAILI